MRATLNATETCSCGAVKPRQKQWCDHCYAHLNEHDRFQFIHAMSMMDAQVKACQRSIDQARRFETPEIEEDNQTGALLDKLGDTIYRCARSRMEEGA